MADPFNDDTDYDFNSLPGGYKNQALALSRQQADSETNAMDLLKQSMQRSAEVTPTQGIAASLLAAIPSLGGYLIGKSVGTPDLGPAGSMHFQNFDEYKKLAGGSGAYAGGLAGTQIGLEGSGSYLQGLDEAQAARADVMQKQASIEAQKSARLEGQIGSTSLAGLAADERDRARPLDEASQMRIEGARSANRLNELNARPTADNRLMEELSDPVKKAAFDQAASGNLTAEVLSALSPEAQREAAQIARSATYNKSVMLNTKKYDEQGILPILETIPGQQPNSNSQKRAQELLVSYTQIKDIVVPELKTAFTNPNATIAEKKSALARAVVAIKNQEGMGASFTVLEERLVKQNLPNIASISNGDFVNYLQAELEGQDTLQKINDLERIAEEGVKRKLPIYGYRLPGTDLGMGGPTLPGVQSSGNRPPPPPPMEGESRENYTKRLSGG